ncbi:MAG TPA: TlyA family RNA methyltransferase, partial [Methylomirabilota bacterium]|nr:TlyA family RNA methyltransferase [Methylomirabilota bacterium]
MSAPTPSRTGSRRRADQLLVERGLAESRAKAQALILAGLVFSGEARVDKPGTALRTDAALEVRGQDHPWVSRGGVKLDHALTHFGIDPAGLTCLDVGASTGGFTDVLLARGAARVYAVDVGHGQLAWKLRQDARVLVLERTNARHLTRAEVPEPVQLIACDASFIGLETVLPGPSARSRRTLRNACTAPWRVPGSRRPTARPARAARPARCRASAPRPAR